MQSPEITRVKSDHGVKSTRLPAWFVKKHNIKRGTYLIHRETKDGRLTIEKWDDYVGRTKKTVDRKAKSNRR